MDTSCAHDVCGREKMGIEAPMLAAVGRASARVIMPNTPPATCPIGAEDGMATLSASEAPNPRAKEGAIEPN